MAVTTRDTAVKRAQRVRTRLKSLANGRPRLSVFRSSKNIYAQIIDDAQGVTLAAASSLEGEKGKTKGADKEAAALVGKLVAERATEKRIKGGSRDTALNELMVMPTICPSSLTAVTTATPVANCPSTRRKARESKPTEAASPMPFRAVARLWICFIFATKLSSKWMDVNPA